MARALDLEKHAKDIQKALSRSLQSGRLNFILGSGAGVPAIPVAGPIENEVGGLFAAGQDEAAWRRLYDFIAGIQGPTNRLITDDPDDGIARTLASYNRFLGILESILSERRTTLLPRQATLFTTNYDLFVEKSSVQYPALRLNDGFTRVPSLDNRMSFSSRNFFNVTYDTGNLYDYKVELPSINLIKLHGSLSWKKASEEIIFEVAAKPLLPADRTTAQVATFLEQYAVVLPQAVKFRTTLIDRTYYDLLRLYANELDRENTLLLAFGFSFGDEHITDITKRALKNPTLRLVIFAFDATAANSYVQKFSGHNNVEVLVPPTGGQIDFDKFNDTLRATYTQSEAP